MTYGLEKYDVIALSSLVILVPMCTGVDVSMSLPSLIISVCSGLFIIQALFPCRTLWRMWLKVFIKWRRLRPKNKPRDELVSPSYYRFVGECYLRGMMDGEAITYQNENNIRHEIFELR